MFTIVEIALIATECDHQHANKPWDFVGLALAYADAKVKGNESLVELENLIIYWAGLINCETMTYRCVPVTVAGRRVGADVQDISSRMLRYTNRFILGQFPDAETAYKEFEEIHPFKDGNGRVGLILYNLYYQRIKGEWPADLAPDVFNGNY